MNDPRRPYVQVADALRTAIREGTLPAGTRLPSGRELAAEYGVALMTVQRAIDVLRSEGLVRSHQGSGVFVRAGADTSEATGGLAELRAVVQDLAERVAALEAREADH